MIIELSGTGYQWVKALHVVSVIAWMAGLFYLPRLYVYHAENSDKPEVCALFKVMERRLLKAITTPAGISSAVFGLLLVLHDWPWIWSQGWWHLKLLGLIGLGVMHVLMVRWRQDFLHDRNTRSSRFYRIANEVPTLCMLAIVIPVIVQPF